MKRPSQDELQILRKGLRKRKVPKVFENLCCSEPGIGGVRVTALGKDYQIEWVTFVDGVKLEPRTAFWSELCTHEALEVDRFEIGFIVSEIMQCQAKAVMDSIGHPMAALKEAEPYRKAAEDWKHWGTVKAGHMTGL